VGDTTVITTREGQRIGVGDRVVSRRNDRNLDVANRDTWVVTAVGRGGALVVTPAEVTPAGGGRGGVRAVVTPSATGKLVLPAEYVRAHVELGYASTAHGVQGDTVSAAHVVIGEHTGAA